MIRPIAFVLAPVALMCCLSCAVRSDEQSVVAPNAATEKLADSFKFTEGPASDAAGNVFFTDQPNDRIHN